MLPQCAQNSIQVDFPEKKICTSRFTDKFGIITEVFRALGKLDPESLYLTTKKSAFELRKAAFPETQQKDKSRTTLEQVQIKFK